MISSEDFDINDSPPLNVITSKKGNSIKLFYDDDLSVVIMIDDNVLDYNRLK